MRTLSQTVDTSKTEISVRMTMEQYQQIMNLWETAKLRDLKISDWLDMTKNEINEKYNAFPLEISEIEIVKFK